MTLRMAKLDRVMLLIHALSESSEGMTLDEMAAYLGVNRRTAERMRDIVALHFDLDERQDERHKRFIIRDSLRRVYTRPTAAEVAALQAEVLAHQSAGRDVRAAPLAALLAKVRGALDDREKRRMDPDLDALTRAQQMIAAPGPRAPVPPGVLDVMQGAIMAGQCVEFDYAAHPRTEPKWRRVIPYGLVHGPLSYLIGKMPDREPTYFRLDRITNARISDRPGCAPEDWDISAWLSTSFGVWREDPYDIRLRILPEGVDRARGWRFHATQSVEELPDGGLCIRFRAGGLRELTDHLFSWAGELVIEEPAALVTMMRERAALASRMVAA